MNAPERFITVGKLGRPRGVRGDIYVTPMTDFPDRFLELTEIFMDVRGEWQTVKIERSAMISGRPVLKFIGYDTPEAVARLTNNRLAVTSAQLIELPDGTFYVFDLIDCRVFEAASGDEIGVVADIVQYPANDVYVIRRTDGTEVTCPAVREFVTEIDIAGKRIVVRAEGLAEESGRKSAP